MLDFNKHLPKSKVVLNRTPRWLSGVLVGVLLIALLYALPNLYGEHPAVQISLSTPGQQPTPEAVERVTKLLQQDKLPNQHVNLEHKHIVVRLNSTDEQIKAKEQLQQALGNQFIVATYNAAATPSWLRALGGKPMKLGLDLRGGMSLLLQVDVDDVIARRLHNSIRQIGQTLRKNKIHYQAIVPTKDHITIAFHRATERDQAYNTLASSMVEYNFKPSKDKTYALLVGQLSPHALLQLRQYTMEQSINRLNRRVNELGISEAQVQQQGVNRIAIELPGVSDATEAQDILGKTATIDTHLVDVTHDVTQTLATGHIPPDSLLLKDQSGRAVLLKRDIVLSGDNITNANASIDQQTAQPEVNVSVAGAAQAKLYNTTRDNIGRPMAVVYNEIKSTRQTINGKMVIHYHKHSEVISVATILGAFGDNFRITGLSSAEAKQLALLLRAGSLPANITVLSDRQVGPSMGKMNVKRGKLSVEIGFILVVLFMALYYRTMGIIADIALFINLILIVAMMSLLGGTLTFPGIASLVLTIGMAVDGNVLIFERIREELRRGTAIQAAIHAGYDRAAVTIIDAQLTTLIAAVVLFAIGVGPIKGFAIVLTIGLFTSMLTSITYTRAMVNFLYGGKTLKKLPIGIHVKPSKRS